MEVHCTGNNFVFLMKVDIGGCVPLKDNMISSVAEFRTWEYKISDISA